MTILDNLIKEAWRRGIKYKARIEELIVHKLNLGEQKGDMKHGWKACVGKTGSLDACGHFPCRVVGEKVRVTKPCAEIVDTVESSSLFFCKKGFEHRDGLFSFKF